MCCSVWQCCSLLQSVAVYVMSCHLVVWYDTSQVHISKRKLYMICQCVAACCSVLQCVAVCCSVLQCVAVYCSVLQCVAVCCSFFPNRIQSTARGTHCNTLQHTATHCNTLQHTRYSQMSALYNLSVCCSVLQHVAACCSMLQCVAVCCRGRYSQTSAL